MNARILVKLAFWLSVFCIPVLSSDEIYTQSFFEKKSAGTKNLVVFLHGVLGDARTTWTDEGTKRFWPMLVRYDSLFNSFDVLCLGYHTPFFSRSLTIEETATKLLSDFTDETSRYRNIVFVCHSMGGILAKRMLICASRSEPDLYAKIKGVVFLSNPANGSEVAHLAAFIKVSPQMHGMDPIVFNDYLQSVENDWFALMRNRTQPKMYPMAFCAYEKLKYLGVVVVDRDLAISTCDNPLYAFPRNHSTIVKPVGYSDEVYRWTRYRIFESMNMTSKLSLTAKSEQIPLPQDTGGTLIPISGTEMEKISSLGSEIIDFRPDPHSKNFSEDVVRNYPIRAEKIECKQGACDLFVGKIEQLTENSFRVRIVFSTAKIPGTRLSGANLNELPTSWQVTAEKYERTLSVKYDTLQAVPWNRGKPAVVVYPNAAKFMSLVLKSMDVNYVADLQNLVGKEPFFVLDKSTATDGVHYILQTRKAE